MKVALVHYWLVGMRGGEKVLEALCELFPDADIFTLVVNYDAISATIKQHRIFPSFLQKFGGANHYQKFLPLMPFALESFDLTPYDLIISSEGGPAKGIIPRPDAVHICYCHSPMRYIWDLYHQYKDDSGVLTRLAMPIFAPILRQWDVTTAHRVDHFIANSTYVAKRIQKFYRREAEVVHPPVDLKRFRISTGPRHFYLAAGQITQYKRIDLAVEACTTLNRNLVVIGSGATERLKKKAGPNVTFLGSVNDTTMEYYFSNCEALLYPGIEDFGIVPLEVMASGRPVIAFARGGALDSLIDGKTGVYFHEQTVESLVDAIQRYENIAGTLDSEQLRAHAQKFDSSSFRQKMKELVFRVAQSYGVHP